MQLQRSLAVALGFGLSATFATSAVTSATEITFLTYPEHPPEAVLAQILSGFEAEHPDIHVNVEYLTKGDMGDKVLLAEAAGDPPAVVYYERSAIIEAAASKQMFTALDDLLPPELRASDAFLPFALDEVRWNGHLYALPWRTDVRAAIWNQDMFSAAGLDPNTFPDTYAALDQYAGKLTKQDQSGTLTQLGFAPWRTGMNVMGWMFGFGGGFYDPATDKPTINSPENLAVMNWELDYARRFPQAVTRTESWSTDFSRAWSAIATGGPNQFNAARAATPDIKLGIGSFPHQPGGENPSWSGGYALGVPRGVKEPQAAVTFLSYLTETGQMLLFQGTGAIPTYMPTVHAAVQAATAGTSSLAPFYAVLLESHSRPPLWGTVYRPLVAAETAVIRQQKTPQQALDDAQKEIAATYHEVLGT